MSIINLIKTMKVNNLIQENVLKICLKFNTLNAHINMDVYFKLTTEIN